MGSIRNHQGKRDVQHRRDGLGGGVDHGIIESPCLGKCMHSDSIPGGGRVRGRVETMGSPKSGIVGKSQAVPVVILHVKTYYSALMMRRARHLLATAPQSCCASASSGAVPDLRPQGLFGRSPAGQDRPAPPSPGALCSLSSDAATAISPTFPSVSSS
jgi:hypothetical protein